MLLWILACKGGESTDSTPTESECTATWYADSDGDGFGDPEESTTACEAPSGWVADSTDCEDGDANSFPGGTEVCDGLDNDCDGVGDADDTDADPTTAQTWYTDADGDGAGVGEGVLSCEPIEGGANSGGDCDDADPARSPGLSEECGDGIDNDCDGGPGPCQWEGELTAEGAQLKITVQATALALWDGQLAVASSAQIDLYNGLSDTSAATWTQVTSVLLGVGDIDADSVPELAVGQPTQGDGGSVVLLNAVPDGEAVTFTEDEAGAETGTALALGDVDGDEDADLLVGSPNWGAGDWGAIYVITNPASALGGSLGATTRLYGAGVSDLGRLVAAADMDGDGVKDIVTANSKEIYWLSGPPVGGVLAPDKQLAYVASALAAAGDVDGDGKEDVIVGNTLGGGGNGEVKILKTNLKTQSTWSGPDGGQVGKDVASLGDVDGDGFADVVVSAPGVEKVYILLAPGSEGGVLDVGADASIANPGCTLSTGDMEGDGVLDLAVGGCAADSWVGVYVTRTP